jgi:hypothetical protein
MLVAIKLIRLKVERSIIAGLTGTILLLIGTGILLSFINLSSWIVSFGIMLISGLIMAFLFKLINIKEFISILKL